MSSSQSLSTSFSATFGPQPPLCACWQAGVSAHPHPCFQVLRTLMMLTRSSPSELFLTPRICDPHIPQRQPSIRCPRFPTNTVTGGTISHASDWSVIFDPPIIRSITIHNSFHARLSLPISIPAATAYICLSSSLSELL